MDLATSVLLRQATDKLIIISGNTKLVVIVAFLPTLLPQADIVLWLTHYIISENRGIMSIEHHLYEHLAHRFFVEPLSKSTLV